MQGGKAVVNEAQTEAIENEAALETEGEDQSLIVEKTQLHVLL